MIMKHCKADTNQNQTRHITISNQTQANFEVLHLKMYYHKYQTSKLLITAPNNSNDESYDAKYAEINLKTIETPAKIIMTYAIPKTQSQIKLILIIQRNFGLYLTLDGCRKTMQGLYNNHDIISINVRCGYFQKVYRIKMKRFLNHNSIGCHYCLKIDEIRSRNLDLISIELQISQATHPTNTSHDYNHSIAPPFNPFKQSYPCTGIKTCTNWKIGTILCHFGRFVRDNGGEYLWSLKMIELGNIIIEWLPPNQIQTWKNLKSIRAYVIDIFDEVNGPQLDDTTFKRYSVREIAPILKALMIIQIKGLKLMQGFHIILANSEKHLTIMKIKTRHILMTRCSVFKRPPTVLDRGRWG
eukprot:482707_1